MGIPRFDVVFHLVVFPFLGVVWASMLICRGVRYCKPPELLLTAEVRVLLGIDMGGTVTSSGIHRNER